MNKKKTIIIKHRKYPRGIVYDDGYEAINMHGNCWLNVNRREGVRIHVPYRIKDNALNEYYDERTSIVLGTLFMDDETSNYILEFPKVFGLENVMFEALPPC